MKKISSFIVDARYFILGLFVILSGISLFVATKVNINSDIMKYLPATSETKQGVDIMEDEFAKQKSSVLNVMFKGLSKDEKESTLKELEAIEGVDNVEYDSSEEFNKDEHTLYIITVKDYSDSETAKNVFDKVEEMKPEATSGSIHDDNATVLKISVVILAITCAMIILIILSDSVAEPFLYLIAIGIAVFINKGTNIMFDSVSNITDSITAILQLALSMDYSIMLSNRYKQEKEHTKDKVQAMKDALHASFKSISSSSVTTVVGLLALVFMSFTIGKDLGIVLAKGVILSLVSIFMCLPALLLLCEGLIEKTKKKSLHFNLTRLGRFSYKTRYGQLIAIIIVFVAVFLAKGNLGILYTASEQDEVGKVFTATNQMAIVYKSEYEDIIAKYCTELEEDEKIDQVLCYSNTINQKLAYNELNQKFSDLGQDTEIDEYLIKLIYYNYYNNDKNNTMTFEQFVTFIKNDVYNNESIADEIDQDTRDNIDLLENFVTNNNIDKQRTLSDIANILSISESDAEQILIFYNSKNNNTTKLTIKEFVDFMYKDVLTDSSYSSEVDNDTKASLEQLKTFTNKTTIYKELTAEEMTNFINQVIGSNVMTNETMNQLYLYYTVNSEPTIKLTLNQFANFSLALSNDPQFASSFDAETIESLKQLAKFTSNEIDTKKTSNEMAEYWSEYGITNAMTAAVYEYYKVNQTVDIPDTTVKEVVEILSKPEVQEIIKDQNVQEAIKNADTIIKNVEDNTTIKKEDVIDNPVVKQIGLDTSMIEAIYNASGKDELTIKEVITIAKESGIVNDEAVKQELVKVDNVVENALNNSSLDPEQVSQIINVKQEVVETVIKVNEQNKTEVKLTPKEFVEFLTNENNKEILGSVDTSIIEKLSLASNIMNNKNNTYSYTEIANFLGKETSTTKTIYNVYYYKNNTIRVNPYNLVNFLIDHQQDDLLKNKITKYMDKIKLVDKVMESTVSNKKYSSSTLANELGIDSSKLELIFSLYNHKYEKNHEKISLYNFINFTIDNVMNSEKYGSKLDNDSRKKLTTVNGIMNATKNFTHYNAYELYSILNELSDNLDRNKVEVIYIYHGSVNNFDEEWKMTVEEFITYLHNDILKDTRFTDFIDSEKRNTINDGYTTIKDAKDLIVSDNYRRIVLNTKYAAEDEETYAFVNSMKDRFGEFEGIYVAGNSPMAVEMSKTFSGELDYITVLTMIFIFVVVALTFRSIIIPFILVLIIQCAVYVTMAVISLMGGNVYFIALLIVQAILMGATIDYAIVYTSYYKESRLTMGIQDSVVNAYNKSIHTILCSSSILILVTLVVANFASAIAAKICETISQGTIAAVLLIVLILPGILAATDKVICRKDCYYKETKNKKIKA